MRPVVFAVAIGLILAVGTAQAADAFLSVAEDVPLAPGLTEQPGAVVFDKPGGRIVEADAQGSVARAQIERFYRDSLPELGWRPAASGMFERDAERLKIGYTAKGRTVIVHFTIAPR